MVLNVLDLLLLVQDRGLLIVVFWVEDRVFTLCSNYSKIMWLPLLLSRGLYLRIWGLIYWFHTSHLWIDRGEHSGDYHTSSFEIYLDGLQFIKDDDFEKHIQWFWHRSLVLHRDWLIFRISILLINVWRHLICGHSKQP